MAELWRSRPNLVANELVIKCDCEAESNRTRHSSFHPLGPRTRTNAVDRSTDDIANECDVPWAAIVSTVVDDGTEGVFTSLLSTVDSSKCNSVI